MLDINPQFQRALELMEHSKSHVFITGRAGTGKSTLLQHFKSKTEKKLVVLAPTGVAAINVGGQTIHSFFGFRPDTRISSLRKTPDQDKAELYKSLKTIVIDEVSMVRADLLDMVDTFLRINGPKRGEPFGGIQMIFIGDLYQLPPVVNSQEREHFATLYPTPYFFSANVFDQLTMELVELQKVYRQNDPEFIRLLNTIRNNTALPEDLKQLNQRHVPHYTPEKRDFSIYLTTTNKSADTINGTRLEDLKGKSEDFEARIFGDVGKEYYPTQEVLRLKVGAQIMMLNNDAQKRWVNGTIGKVGGFLKTEEGQVVVQATLEDGKEVVIEPFSWEIFSFSLENGDIAAEVVGTFTQLPLRLAFAITIHKSQGKTFQKAVIDFERGTFAHGQAYVALSRCVSLEGMVLKQPLRKSHIRMDWQVERFLSTFQERQVNELQSQEEKG